MSKGNKAVKVRLTQEKLAAIEAEIMRKRKHFATPEDYSVSDFIREAIAEKLDHVERCKRASKKRRLSVHDPMLVEHFEDAGQAAFDGRFGYSEVDGGQR